MLENDAVRLRPMMDAARQALSFAKNKRRKSLNNDPKLTLALVKCIQIIGEAATRVTAGQQEEIPQIRWADITGMRNRLIHAYDDIDLDILWKTVIRDLPPLIAELEKVVPPVNERH